MARICVRFSDVTSSQVALGQGIFGIPDAMLRVSSDLELDVTAHSQGP